MKTFIILGFLSASAFAQVSDNVSSTCYRYSVRRMSEAESYHFCSNVADNCFRAFVGRASVEVSRNTCLNVSSDCFQELQRASKTEAAKTCENVLNSCFVVARMDGLSIKESVARCKDASY